MELFLSSDKLGLEETWARDPFNDYHLFNCNQFLYLLKVGLNTKLSSAEGASMLSLCPIRFHIKKVFYQMEKISELLQ